MQMQKSKKKEEVLEDNGLYRTDIVEAMRQSNFVL